MAPCSGVVFFVLVESGFGLLVLSLFRNRQTQQINKIGHELQGVPCKVHQDMSS